MQEVYEIIDADVKRFIPPPKEIKTIHDTSKGDSTPKIEHLRMDIKARTFPPHAGSSLYMVDEN